MRKVFKPALFAFGIIAVGGGVFVLYNHFFTPDPRISIDSPSDHETVTKETLFVKGNVAPSGSWVSVNGEQVFKNGDGSFTAVVNVNEGENKILVEAAYKGKKSSLVRLITRHLTEDEKVKKEQVQKLTQIQQREEVLGIDQKIDELIVAYENKENYGFVRVLNHKIEEKAGFKKIAGEVINNSEADAYWIKITVSFFDSANNVVDTKTGFAVSLDQFLKPEEKAIFETQSTTRDFAYYKLSVSWQKSGVAK